MKASALALVLLAACERDAVLPPESRPVAKAAVPAAHAPAAPQVAARARVLENRGTITPALGGEWVEGQALTLASDAVLALTIDDDVRIEIHGPAQVALHGERGLLVHAGLVAIDVAAHAIKAGQRPFSLATTAGELEVPFAARFVVQASPAGATELALISGEAALARPDGTQLVGASTRVCLGVLGPRTLRVPGFGTVEAAVAGLPQSSACAGEQGPALAQLASELTQSLDALARTKAQEQALLGDYARGQTTPEGAQRLRKGLVQHAELAIATRRRALTLYAQLAAAQLGGEPDRARAALLARAHALENPAR
ncbi:MAG TPA: hypothetical protein VI299_05160 [Polyangiales bacterium]